MRKSWNKGLTKETDERLARVSSKKAEWWKTTDTTETRKKIGETSKGRVKGGKLHPSWRGGKFKTHGYVMVYCPDHPHAVKQTHAKSYILEHRLVMEKVLGRYLTINEEVHHINGVKDDNRPENLKVVIKQRHFSKVCCPKCSYEFEVK
jgi:hypothetical protein